MLLLLITIGYAYEYWGFSFNSSKCSPVGASLNITISNTNYSCDMVSTILSTNANIIIDPLTYPSLTYPLTYSNFTLLTTIRNENNAPNITITIFENENLSISIFNTYIQAKVRFNSTDAYTYQLLPNSYSISEWNTFYAIAQLIEECSYLTVGFISKQRSISTVVKLAAKLEYTINSTSHYSFQLSDTSGVATLKQRVKIFEFINKDLSVEELKRLCIMNNTAQFSVDGCIPLCKTCIYGDTNNCVDCLLGSYLIYSGKMHECSEGYEIKSEYMPYCCIKNCSQCNSTEVEYRNIGNLAISNCSVCYSTSTLQCILDKCYCTCESKHYFNNYYYSCQDCHFLCKECYGSASNCSSCIEIAELEIDTCTCINGYFYLKTNECLPCAWACKKCTSFLNTTCKTCIVYDLMKLYTPSTCDCIEGYYYFNNSYCRPCHPLCIKCFGDFSTSCIMCMKYEGVEMVKLTHCVCSVKFYYDQEKLECLPCHSLCENCVTKFDICLGCYDNYTSEQLKNSTCVCKRHFYYDLDAGECFECHPLCENCFQPLDDLSCTTCIERHEVTNITENGKLRCICAIGFYFNDRVNFCEACNKACYSCNGGTAYDCFLCSTKDVYIRRNGMCLLNCTSLSIGLVCIDCRILRCKKCTTSVCVECVSPYYLIDGGCLDDCPFHTYKNIISGIRQCSQCNYKCLTCSGSKANQCIECDIQYMKDNQQIYCITKVCKQNEYIVEYMCYSCHYTCNTCMGPTEYHCTSCFYGSVAISKSSSFQCKKCNEIQLGLIYSASTQTCIEKCGDGIKLGMLECDDGNLISKDGCSSTCKTEKGWNCSTPNGLCRYTISPKLRTVKISKQLSFMIVFSHPIRTQSRNNFELVDLKNLISFRVILNQTTNQSEIINNITILSSNESNYSKIIEGYLDFPKSLYPGMVYI